MAEFVEDVSGGLISNGLGLITDRLAYLRLKQAFSLRDKVNEELRHRGVAEPREVFPKILVPLLQAATIEENEELHDRYATLLANARDPNYLGKVSRSFVSILNDLEPIDVLILDVTHDGLANRHKTMLLRLDRMVHLMGIPLGQAEISLRNLVRLGLLKPGVVVAEGITYSGHQLTSYKDIEQFGITELGIAFVAATRPHPAGSARKDRSAA